MVSDAQEKLPDEEIATPNGAGEETAEAADEAKAAATVEAILLTTDKPLPPAKVSEIGQLGGVRKVRRAVELLNQRYEQTGGAFRIVYGTEPQAALRIHRAVIEAVVRQLRFHVTDQRESAADQIDIIKTALGVGEKVAALA